MASILIIDDMESVRGLFRDILQQAGHVVCEASTGSEGIRLFREAPTDVVITDIYMPEGDGLEVTTQLRQQCPALKIIAISGRGGTDEMLSAAKLMGADLILPKPVPMQKLLTAVEQLLDETRLPCGGPQSAEPLTRRGHPMPAGSPLSPLYEQWGHLE
jgi:CheY-like chemotaxis protein